MATKARLSVPDPSSAPANPVSGRPLIIAAPNFIEATFTATGTAPLVLHAWDEKQRRQMREKQESGQRAKKGAAREAKDFDAAFEGARHVSTEGWDGVPANAFRKAMVTACSTVGYKMTHARIGFLIVQDGFDAVDGTPLVRIIGPPPRKHEAMVRVANGQPDIRIRPQWLQWACKVTVRWDGEMFSQQDIANLLERAGSQCGVGEGRPSSPSGGMGWGLFTIRTGKDAALTPNLAGNPNKQKAPTDA